MRIAKPMLLVLTPIGVGWGLYEAWRLAGGLVIVMLAFVGLVSAAFAQVIATARRERSAEQARTDDARSRDPRPQDPSPQDASSQDPRSPP